MCQAGMLHHQMLCVSSYCIIARQGAVHIDFSAHQLTLSVLARVQTAIGDQPLSALPNFGGTSAEHAEGVRAWNLGSVPTPKELVEALNKSVIGQASAKRVCLAACLHLGPCMLPPAHGSHGSATCPSHARPPGYHTPHPSASLALPAQPASDVLVVMDRNWP